METQSWDTAKYYNEQKPSNTTGLPGALSSKPGKTLRIERNIWHCCSTGDIFQSSDDVKDVIVIEIFKSEKNEEHLVKGSGSC